MSTAIGSGIGTAFQSDGGAEPLLLPIDQSLVIADWISDLGVAGTGANVASWTDQVNGHVLSQGTGTNQPTLVASATPSGRPALRFDGVNDFLRLASFDLSAHQDVDIWMVTKRVKSSTLQVLFDYGDNPPILVQASSDAADRMRVAIAANTGGLNDERDSDATLANVFRSYNCRALVSRAVDEAQGFYDEALTRFDTKLASDDNTNANLANQELTLGGRRSAAGGGLVYGGDVSRFAFVQTSADRAAIAQFLAPTYGTP